MSPRTHPNSWILALLLVAGSIVACGPGDDGGAAEGPLEKPGVVITIESGDRAVFVDGVRYGRGVHRPNITFPDTGPATLRLGEGDSRTHVGMDIDGLKEILVYRSSSNPPSTLVFGFYESMLLFEGPIPDTVEGAGSTAAFLGIEALAEKTWKCIWCQGEVLVCGVEPTCGGDIRP